MVRNNGLNATIPSPEKRQRACIATTKIIYTLILNINTCYRHIKNIVAFKKKVFYLR